MFLVLVGFVGTLLLNAYRAQRLLQDSRLDALVEATQRATSHLTHFFSQRLAEQEHLLANPHMRAALAHAPDTADEPARRDAELCMSEFAERCTSGGKPVYQRVALVTREGTMLLDTSTAATPDYGLGAILSELATRDADQRPTVVAVIDAQGRPAVAICTPCTSSGKARHTAYLLALVDIEQMKRTFAHSAAYPVQTWCFTLGNRIFCIANPSVERFADSVRELTTSDPGVPVRFARRLPDGTVHGVIAIRQPMAGTELSLVNAASAKAILGHSTPWEYPLAMAVIAVAILVATALVLRARVHAMVVGVRLEEAVGHRQSIEEKNRLLNREIAERRLLATAVEQSAEAIIITTTDGTIEYVNPAFEAITGFSREEAVGRKPSLVMSGRHTEAFYQDLWRTLQNGGVWIGRFNNRRKDGTLYEEDAVISPVRDSSGKIVNYVAVKRDVTDQVAMEAQLRQSQRMEAIGELAGGVAHDFNNLLTVILGSCNLLLCDADRLDAAERENIDEILEAGTRATSLTRQLLAFSRRQPSNPMILSLVSVVANMEKMLRRLIRENVSIQTRLPDYPIYVNADPVQIDQIVINLAVNARDAMPNGGALSIAVTETEKGCDAQKMGLKPGRYAVLELADTGIGMTEATRARIFEPFFTTKAEDAGTGLGLATVYGIVKQNGGDIEVESKLDVGTTFRILLPRAPDEIVLAQEQEKQETAEGLSAGDAQGTETILVVDDEQSVLHMTRRVLELSGYTVLAAQNDQEVLRFWEERREDIDMLLTDVVMPGMSGKDLGTLLTADRPDLRVLLMSAYTDEAILNLADGGGQFAFLQKPFTPDVLLQEVRKVLDQVRPG